MRGLTLRGFKIGFVAAPTLVLACALAPAAGRAADTKAMETELNRVYKDQVLILRNFYGGNLLRYDADGRLLEGGSPGAWTVDADVEFDRMKFHRRQIEVDGTRIWLAYDQKSKQFGQVRWPGYNVRIEIEADPKALTLRQAQNLMAKVFLTKNEKLEDFVPPYWRKFLSWTSGPGASEQQPPLPARETGHKFTAPVALAHDEPPYSEEARRAQTAGDGRAVAECRPGRKGRQRPNTEAPGPGVGRPGGGNSNEVAIQAGNEGRRPHPGPRVGAGDFSPLLEFVCRVGRYAARPGRNCGCYRG